MWSLNWGLNFPLLETGLNLVTSSFFWSRIPSALEGKTLCSSLSTCLAQKPAWSSNWALLTLPCWKEVWIWSQYSWQVPIFQAGVYLKITQVFFCSQFSGTLGDLINNSRPGVKVKHSFDQWIDLGMMENFRIVTVRWCHEGCHGEVAQNSGLLLLPKVWTSVYYDLAQVVSPPPCHELGRDKVFEAATSAAVDLMNNIFCQVIFSQYNYVSALVASTCISRIFQHAIKSVICCWFYSIFRLQCYMGNADCEALADDYLVMDVTWLKSFLRQQPVQLYRGD